MPIEYCPKCQSYQNMCVTITESINTITKSINIDEKGLIINMGKNGKIISVDNNGKIINIANDGKTFTMITKSFHCSKCNTFVKSVNSEKKAIIICSRMFEKSDYTPFFGQLAQ